jgi:DNA-binding Lrp family transcriptional regulator
MLCVHIDGIFPYLGIMMKAIDHVDHKVIAAPQDDGRASLAEIAKVVGLSRPAVGERLRRLQSDGVIEGYRLCASMPELLATRWRLLPG